MTERELRLESERLIEEALREIEAIKQALESSREKPPQGGVTQSSQGAANSRTN
jgi:hypothetical protein